MYHREQVNPVAAKALARRAKWEAERVARIWEMVERGLISEEEAKIRLELP